MVGNLLLGEWRKVNGNRITTIMFIWIAPIGALMMMGLIILIAAFSEEARTNMARGQLQPWNETFLFGWLLVNNEIGRYIIAAFTAIVFAGEYQFGTWKNFVPYRRRTTLLLTKFALIGVLVLVAWVSMTLIIGFGFLILGQILGADSGAVNGDILRDFLGDYALQMALTLSATLIAACYAALAAMFTRSTIASFFVAVIISIAETGILLPISIIYQFFRVNLFALYTYTPSFNLFNIQSLVQSGRQMSAPAVPGTVTPSHSLETSLLIIVIWVFVLLGVTLWRFNRQDITT